MSSSISSRTSGSTGNAYFKQQVSAQLSRLQNQIPSSYHLPESLLDNPPLNVTSIPETCGILTKEELAITDLDATDIVTKIRSGELTAVAVVTAFGKRAAIAHQLTACLTDFFLEEGIQRAKELDAYFKVHGTTIGPLHGLPISIKDHMPVKGRWGSAGFLSTLQISSDDCFLTSVLRDLGAVFYVKTNQPQTIMHLETQSFYGRTLNPHNLNLSPGGSSGGEAALLALKGSCMGMGRQVPELHVSDGGGSIRAPCAFAGLYGIRPTGNTFPFSGVLGHQDGNDSTTPSGGPMCRSARDLEMLIKAAQSTEPWLRDPSLFPIPLQLPNISQKKLRIGVMFHDRVVMPHPPMLRALRLAETKLRASEEVEVVEYVPYNHKEGYSIIRGLYFYDGGETVRRLLKDGGEDILPLSEWVISPPHTRNLTATQSWELRHKRDLFRHAYLQQWREQQVDVLLCPPYTGVAPRHDTARYWGYTAIWNLLDYPGAVFPTGLVVDPALDPADSLASSLGPEDSYNRQQYEPNVYVGAPINLQIVAPRFNDGMVLAALNVIERIVKS
ncbi:amidase signature domain-containing protein [Boletus edulis BED1]|uniref:Amidase signature domain-containing protein n=1 Tax=Boletus edulis BED1 TaxID=1328754 RepID=A0AAD4BMC5_BOLED|nr:amidase signature domain-containing protein [Boletus edulis BED1]